MRRSLNGWYSKGKEQKGAMSTKDMDLVPTGKGASVPAGDLIGCEKFVTFGLAGSEYGIDIFQVKEIIRLPEQVTAMPQAPGVVLGLIQLRGTLVPLVCLRRVFTLPEITNGDRKVLVTETPQGMVGLVVDDVREVRQIPLGCQEHMRSMRKDFSDRFIGGIANLEDHVTLLLDLDALNAEYGAQLH
jgi:chemotaxis signal transduction protein